MSLSIRQVDTGLDLDGVTATSTTAQSPGLSLPSGTLGAAIPSVSTVPNLPSSQGITIGPYTCTSTIQLTSLTTLLFDYLQRTENNLAAHLIFLTMNLHSTANSTSPLSAADAPKDLSFAIQNLGSIIKSNFSNYVYTPTDLRSDRANLNSSWYVVPERFRPAEEYYTTSRSQNGIISTTDGWATDYYLEFTQRKRLLVDFGSIDPQMSDDSAIGNQENIFSPGYISNNQSELSINSRGKIDEGCLVDGGRTEKANASWAVSSIDFLGQERSEFLISNSTRESNAASDLVDCGITPIFNTTVDNTTAGVNVAPYQRFIRSTIWSWAPGEPRVFTEGAAEEESLFRCATIATNGQDAGRWHVADCSSKFYAACRARGRLNDWTVATYQVSYSFAAKACPEGYIFAAPRTAAENAYLNQSLYEMDFEDDEHGLWLDINSLDQQDCWVANIGPDAQCPYTDKSQMHNVDQQYVLVSFF